MRKIKDISYEEIMGVQFKKITYTKKKELFKNGYFKKNKVVDVWYEIVDISPDVKINKDVFLLCFKLNDVYNTTKIYREISVKLNKLLLTQFSKNDFAIMYGMLERYSSLRSTDFNGWLIQSKNKECLIRQTFKFKNVKYYGFKNKKDRTYERMIMIAFDTEDKRLVFELSNGFGGIKL